MEDEVEVYFQNESISHLDNMRVERIVLPIYLGLIGVLGLVGNGMLIWVIMSSKEMRNINVNLLVVNLAVACIILILASIPFSAAYVALQSWPFGKVWCIAHNYLIIVTIYSIMYTLVLTSIDRFLVTVFPAVSKRVCTLRNIYVAILVLWFLLFTCCIPVTFRITMIETYDQGYDAVHCVILHNFYAVISGLATSFVLPLIAVVVCFVSAIIRQKRHTSTETVASAEKHITCLMAITTSAVFIIRLLAIIVNILSYFTSHLSHSAFHAIGLAVFALQYVIILVNPVLYTVVWKKFPETFRSLSYRYSRLQEESTELMPTEMGSSTESTENQD